MNGLMRAAGELLMRLARHVAPDEACCTVTSDAGLSHYVEALAAEAVVST